MTEAPTFQPAENPAAAGFADPAVIMKINALMGQIIKEDQVDSMGAVGMWTGMCLGLLCAATLIVRRVRLISTKYIDEH